MDLKKLRNRIDSIDAKILGLLNDRANITLDIGKFKAKKGRSIFVPERETDVYNKLVSRNKGPLSSTSVKAIYREIMSGALSLEKELEVAYLGPQFTFTHMASMKKFGSSVTYKPCATITEVFNEVERSRADYGVVPIENSIDGAINHTLDMFIDSDLKICSEIFLEVVQSLMSKESDITKIKKIYSKYEVFGQCRQWLEANLPRAELIEASSTAKAAEIAAKEKNAACIASESVSKKYNLNVLARSIEDSSHNVTRFLVIGRTEAKPTKNDKMSIMFSVKDRSGALHDMLVPFKKYNINMTKIESRPSKIKPWEYYFFVDIEGHCQDKKVRKALSELEKQASYLKILGSYPIGK